MNSLVKYCLFSVCFLLATQCRTADSRPDTIGQDYLDREFKCTYAPLGVEADVRVQLMRTAFRETWKTSRTNADIVFTGDSTMAIFGGDRLQKMLPGFDIVNRAIGGETTAGLLERLDQDVVSLRPRVVAIVIGGNDLLGGRCMRIALQNTGMILQKLKTSLPNTKVIMVSIPPVVSWKASSITPYYNRKLEYLTRDMGITFLDLWPAMGDLEKPGLKQEYRFIMPNGKEDQVHFNEAGYLVFANLLRPLIGP
ncbi:MAG: hypothetical protein JNM27_09890 [Leptospirales bacterium]|nr:hypothetical protein [Leptospirales bacterium]